MLRHVEVQHLATTMFQHDENEEYPHSHRRHRKEVDRHQLAEVVVQKRLPRLSRWPVKRSENSRDRALGDLDAEHLQFAVNSWCTPQRVGRSHLFNQPANLGSGGRSTTSPAVYPGQACPELAKRSRCHRTTVSGCT